MLNESRIDIYDYLSNLMATVSPNVYPMGEPTENTDSDVDNGFIVIRVGDIVDASEFNGDAFANVRCYIIAYVPKRKQGRLNKSLYKNFEDGINGVIASAQTVGGDSSYYILQDSVISMDDDEMAQQNNQYHVFIKSFIVVIDNKE